jgi:tetratricopeptide (TPR) repeat protein
MKIKIPYFPLLIIIFLITASGCMKIAVRMSPVLLNNISSSIFEEYDYEIAKQAIPANLKILEGLLKSDPQNPDILRLLSIGYCGYSLLFIEGVEDDRASSLYLKGATYGFKAAGFSGVPENMNKQELIERLSCMEEKLNNESIMWATASWSLWIKLNIHKPEALAQLGDAQLCIDKLVEKYPDTFFGLPFLLKALSHSVKPAMLGGDFEKAKEYYDNALRSGKRMLFLSQYYYARYYCVGIQNREMYISLLNEIISGNIEYPEELSLINSVFREKAKILLNNIDDYFI